MVGFLTHLKGIKRLSREPSQKSLWPRSCLREGSRNGVSLTSRVLGHFLSQDRFSDTKSPCLAYSLRIHFLLFLQLFLRSRNSFFGYLISSTSGGAWWNLPLRPIWVLKTVPSLKDAYFRLLTNGSALWYLGFLPLYDPFLIRMKIALLKRVGARQKGNIGI